MGRGNKVHYGKCESGEWSNSCVKNSLRFSDFHTCTPGIRHFHISHNAPYLPTNILHKDCFLFLLGPPGEMKNKGYAKLGGGGGWVAGIRCIMGNVRVANGAIHVLRTRYSSVIFRYTR